MARREAYARAVTEWHGTEYISGQEIRPGDLVVSLIISLKDIADAAHLLGHGDWFIKAQRMEGRIQERWPGRAYFIEVGNDSEGWVQLFQPYDLPRVDLGVGGGGGGGAGTTIRIQHATGCLDKPRSPRGCDCGKDHHER